MVTSCKNSYFILSERSDFHIINNLYVRYLYEILEKSSQLFMFFFFYTAYIFV